MRRALLSAGFFLCIIGGRGASATEAATNTNLVVNGDFAQGAAGWQFAAQNGAKATGNLDASARHEGHAAFKLTNRSPQGPHIYGRLFQLVPGLRPYTTYRVSCWVK